MGSLSISLRKILAMPRARAIKAKNRLIQIVCMVLSLFEITKKEESEAQEKDKDADDDADDFASFLRFCISGDVLNKIFQGEGISIAVLNDNLMGRGVFPDSAGDLWTANDQASRIPEFTDSEPTGCRVCRISPFQREILVPWQASMNDWNTRFRS